MKVRIRRQPTSERWPVNELRAQKALLGLDGETIAKRAEVTESTVSRVLMGQDNVLTDSLFAVAKALGKRVVIKFEDDIEIEAASLGEAAALQHAGEASLSA